MANTDVVVALRSDALPRLPRVIGQLVPQRESLFLAALELGYLAASADGLDDSERDQLAHTLERVTGLGFDHESLAAHFADLDDTVAALGRRERLARTAAEFDSDSARADAIRFAALVAMSDGSLRQPELHVLEEAGSHFAWAPEKILALVTDAAARVGGGS